MNLFQKVVADVFNYDQSDISRIEGSTRLPDMVELENLAVWLSEAAQFFPAWKAPLSQTSGQRWRPLSPKTSSVCGQLKPRSGGDGGRKKEVDWLPKSDHETQSRDPSS